MKRRTLIKSLFALPFLPLAAISGSNERVHMSRPYSMILHNVPAIAERLKVNGIAVFRAIHDLGLKPICFDAEGSMFTEFQIMKIRRQLENPT